MTAKHVTSHLQALFSEYGWPDTLVSDNWPCYNVTDFRQAMEGMSVYHITSSPHYHQSNRLAGKYVKLVESLRF